jgi:hypothetical protein
VLLCALGLWLGACTSATSGDTTLGAPPPCTAGGTSTPVAGCEAGIPPASCAAGFESDGTMGCTAVLPADPCDEGLLAIPGETTCHAPASCGDGTFGDIPVEANSEFVDATYGGADSDGSQQKPWTTIGAAVTAAEPGAIVAIAAGSYGEDVAIGGKAVRLWGRCPAEVEIVGTGTTLAAVVVTAGADGSELHALGVSGAAGGVRVEASEQIVLDGLWIHDTADRGVTLQLEPGPVSATIRASLIEHATVVGVQVVGATLTLSESSVRDTLEADPGGVGQGLVVQPHTVNPGSPSAEIHSAVFERNHTASVLVLAAEATIDSSVVRDTVPSQLSQRDGLGVLVLPDGTARGTLTLSGSVVASNFSRGIAVLGSDAAIATSAVRDTSPQQWDSNTGEGIAVLDAGTERANVTIERSLVERSCQSGVMVQSSDVSIRSTLIRDTAPRGSDRAFGRGMAVVREQAADFESSATIDSCRIENSHAFGIWVADAAVTVSSTLIAATAPQESNGDFGDAMAVATLLSELGTPASLEVSGSRLDQNTEAGLVDYGSALTFERSTLDCNGADILATSSYFGKQRDFTVADGGGNLCGCGSTRRPCTAETF